METALPQCASRSHASRGSADLVKSTTTKTAKKVALNRYPRCTKKKAVDCDADEGKLPPFLFFFANARKPKACATSARLHGMNKRTVHRLAALRSQYNFSISIKNKNALREINALRLISLCNTEHEEEKGKSNELSRPLEGFFAWQRARTH